MTDDDVFTALTPEQLTALFSVGGRSLAIIAFVLAHQSRVNDAYRGSVEFHFEGPELKPSLHEHFERLRLAS